MVEFGFAGEIVADTWNPLRVSMRDQEAAELTLEIDRGSLREGEQPVHYRAPLAGGSGIYVFEDDLFIPAWRTFTWAVRTPERVLASGSVERRQVDPRPLHLVLASELGAQRDLFGPDARTLDLLAAELPERAAAYRGVAALLVAAADLPPRPQALAAAAAAGSTVLLLEPLPPTYDALLALVPAPQQRLGAGWLARAGEGAARARLRSLPSLDQAALLEALATPELGRAPERPAAGALLLGLGLYALAALLLVRFGRVPGLLTALLLALAASLVGWSALRPTEPLLVRSRSLTLVAGELATRLELRTLFSLPAQEARVEGSFHPLDAPTWSLTPEALLLGLPRWSHVTLAAKPELTPPPFRWRGGALVNLTGGTLDEVFVIGLGQQEALRPGGTAHPGLGDSLPPEAYRALLPLLPRGSALARTGGSLFVALPQENP